MYFKKILLFKLIMSLTLIFLIPSSFAMEERDKGINNNNIVVSRKAVEPFYLYQSPRLNKFIFLKRAAEVDLSLMQKSFYDPNRIIMILDQRLFCNHAMVDKPFLMITDWTGQMSHCFPVDPIVILDESQQEYPMRGGYFTLSSIKDSIHRFWNDLWTRGMSEIMPEVVIDIAEELLISEVLIGGGSPVEAILAKYIFRDSLERNHRVLNEFCDSFESNHPLVSEGFEKLKNWFSRCFNGLSGDDEDSEANS